jgi:predicted enzyme related to lactoylglutathione lyase
MSATAVSTTAASANGTAVAEREHAINWFEIPCQDLERATNFYETVLGRRMQRVSGGDPKALFAATPTGTGGTLVQRTLQKPGAGALVYLNCDGDLDDVIARIADAGGLVLLPKTEVTGGHGYIACLRDTEGNHIGLHSH